MTPARARALGLGLALGLALGARADEPLPARQQALLLLRVLAYDRHLPDRAGEAVTVAIVVDEADPGAAAHGRELRSALDDAARGFVVAHLPVKVVRCGWTRGEALAECLGAGRAAAALVVGGAIPGGEVARATRRVHALSFAAARDQVEAGLAIGLVQRASRAALLVNLAAARAEGAELDSALLVVAEVFEGEPLPPPRG